jgi:hypothetical protein
VLAFSVQRLVFSVRVQGFGFRIEGLGFRDYESALARALSCVRVRL